MTHIIVYVLFQKISETLEIPDDRNIVSMPAIDLFASTIRAIKHHFEKAVEGRGLTFISDNILYVLTVPAIWSESAKEFMKKAAKKVFFLHNQDGNGFFIYMLLLNSRSGVVVAYWFECSHLRSKIGCSKAVSHYSNRPLDLH